jgi:predicted aspartyl protease
MIPWRISEVLDYHPELSRDRVNMTTASGVEKVPLITLKAVSVLGKEVENVKAIVHDLPAKSYVDGLLGLSFLRNFKFCLDFKKGIIELE